MPYKKIKLELNENNGKKAFCVLMQSLKVSINEAQKLIDKKRLFCNGKVVSKKNEILNGLIELVVYENEARGVEVVFENDEFAVLEKPSGVLSHPNGRNCKYSLSDEIWSLWGKNACVAHRLDKQTSGLILVAKNKPSQILLKQAFEKKQIQKEYLALVSGKTALEFNSNKPLALAKFDEIKTRMEVNEKGKEALSKFKALRHFEKLNATLLLCKPLTGRQHQLRVHLFDLGHKILGESLYGLKKAQIESILDEKLSQKELIELTGASRLCLHSRRLKFSLLGKEFDFVSKFKGENFLSFLG